MNKVSKHREIYETLVAEIIQGTYDETSRVPSETQLVRRFGVSRPTAARALRDLQQNGLVDRRVGSGSFLTKGGKASGGVITPHLGVLVPNREEFEIFDVIYGELASLARVHGYSLILGGSRRIKAHKWVTSQDADEICRLFIDQKISGVFFAPFEFSPDMEEASRRTAEHLRAAGICVILLDRDIVSAPKRSNFDLVSIDNTLAGYLSAEHLIKVGVDNFVYVARPNSAPTIMARATGAREALHDMGLPVSKHFLQIGDPVELAFVRKLRAIPGIKGAICANDSTAAQLMQSLVRLKVSVPEEFKIIGCDGLKYSEGLPIPLTTIAQPCREIAIGAMRAMIDRLANPMLPPMAWTIAPRLVVRESCGTFL